MSQQIPFPAPNGRPGAGKPKLPRMSEQERRIWANSHNLPAGILLIYEEEMRMIQAATVGSATEVRKWRAVGRVLSGAQAPEQAHDLLAAALNRASDNAARLEFLVEQYERERRAFSDHPDDRVVTILVWDEEGTCTPIDGPNYVAAVDAGIAHLKGDKK